MTVSNTYSGKTASRLRSKQNEQLSILYKIENILCSKRGYAFRMPKASTAVILLLSGGMDSIISWAILMKKFRLRVYPVFLIRRELSEEKKEIDAIDYYSEIFKRKYVANYIAPHKMKIGMPEFSDMYRDLTGHLHPQVILDNIFPDGSLKNNFSMGHFSLFPYLGFVYAKYLLAKENVRAYTIYCGTTFCDNSTYRTLTSSRSIMLTLGLLSGEDDWQYTSIAYEPTINSLLTKSDLIRWASSEKIPLNKTWSCTKKKSLQCGKCLACLSRIGAFQEAKIDDLTLYNIEKQSFIGAIKQKAINRVKRAIIYLGSRNKDEKIYDIQYKKSRKSNKYEQLGKSKVYLSV